MPKKYEYEVNSEVFPRKTRSDLRNKKLHPLECFGFGLSNHIIKDYKKKCNIFVSCREGETLNKTEKKNAGGIWGSRKSQNKT